MDPEVWIVTRIVKEWKLELCPLSFELLVFIGVNITFLSTGYKFRV